MSLTFYSSDVSGVASQHWSSVALSVIHLSTWTTAAALADENMPYWPYLYDSRSYSYTSIVWQWLMWGPDDNSESSMTPRSCTFDDGWMCDPANLTRSLLRWCWRRWVAHHMKSVFAGFNFRRLDAIHWAISSMQLTRSLTMPDYHYLWLIVCAKTAGECSFTMPAAAAARPSFSAQY